MCHSSAYGFAACPGRVWQHAVKAQCYMRQRPCICWHTVLGAQAAARSREPHLNGVAWTERQDTLCRRERQHPRSHASVEGPSRSLGTAEAAPCWDMQADCSGETEGQTCCAGVAPAQQYAAACMGWQAHLHVLRLAQTQVSICCPTKPAGLSCGIHQQLASHGVLFKPAPSTGQELARLWPHHLDVVCTGLMRLSTH